MQRFECFQMDVHLPLIVGRAASKNISVSHFRLEGWRGPELQRLGGLDVIMTVEKNRRLAGCFEGFGINEGVKTCGNDFNGFEAGGTEAFGDPFRSAVDVGLVLAFWR